MSNVIPLRPSDRAHVQNAAADDGAEGPDEASRLQSLLRGVLAAALGGLRMMLFLVLLWMRGPLRFLLTLFEAAALIALPVIGFGLGHGAPHKAAFMWAIGGGAFAAFAALYVYDSLLLRLARRPMLL